MTHNIPNGYFEVWSSGVPADMDVQLTNTTLVQLTKAFESDDARRTLFNLDNQFIGEGFSSLRATLTAAASADDFRVFTEGINATAHTGDSPQAITLTDLRRYAFTFWARGTENNLLRVRVILLEADGTDPVYLVSDPSDDTAADATLGQFSTSNSFIVVSLNPFWTQYGFHFQKPAAVGALNPAEFVWQISNGTAGAQTIDLDQVELEDISMSGGA